jgi:hypothetical protein
MNSRPGNVFFAGWGIAFYSDIKRFFADLVLLR